MSNIQIGLSPSRLDGEDLIKIGRLIANRDYIHQEAGRFLADLFQSPLPVLESIDNLSFLVYTGLNNTDKSSDYQREIASGFLDGFEMIIVLFSLIRKEAYIPSSSSDPSSIKKYEAPVKVDFEKVDIPLPWNDNYDDCHKSVHPNFETLKKSATLAAVSKRDRLEPYTTGYQAGRHAGIWILENRHHTLVAEFECAEVEAEHEKLLVSV